MLLGADSASPPTLAEARQAYAYGVRWWGFYLNGKDGDEDPLETWTPAQVQVLRDAGLIPVPIIVPAPFNPGDPVDAANEAVATAQLAGCRPTVAILYNGNHIAATGPVWLPIPGPAPSGVGPGSAIQYGQGSFGATSVDLSASTDDFPASDGIVADLEYNATADSAWYKAFQDRVRFLGGPVAWSRGAVPVPVEEFQFVWLPAGSLGLASPARLDVMMRGNDGKVYHEFYVPDQGWAGPEIITDPASG